MASQPISTSTPAPWELDRDRMRPGGTSGTGGAATPVASSPAIDTASSPPSGGYNAWTNPTRRQDLQAFLAGNPSAKPNPIRGRAYSNAGANPLVQAQGGARADMWRAQQARRRGLGRGRGFNRGFQGQLRGAYDQFLKGQAGGTDAQAAGPRPSKDFRNRLGGVLKQRPGATGPYNPGPIGGTGGVREPIYKSPVMPEYPVSQSPAIIPPGTAPTPPRDDTIVGLY